MLSPTFAFAPSLASPTNFHQLYATSSSTNRKKKSKNQSKEYKTIGEMMQAYEKNPGKFSSGRSELKKKPKRTSRTRQKVLRPKQKYVYASQRRAIEQLGGDGEKRDVQNADEEREIITLSPQQQQQLLRQKSQEKELQLVRSLGFNPASQAADAIVGDGPEETAQIISSLQFDSEVGVTSSSFVYVVYKPVGWSILGPNIKKNVSKQTSTVSTVHKQGSKAEVSQARAYDEETDEFSFVKYNEADVLAALTPEELDELLKDGGLKLDDGFADTAKAALAKSEFDDDDADTIVELNKKEKKNKKKQSPGPLTMKTAQIKQPTRPSLINWLKHVKSSEGIPIKGGKNWVAMAGATSVDDSGLVLLCPRDRVQDVHVDRCGYVAVVGNGKKLVSRLKLKSSGTSVGETFDSSTAHVEVLSRLKRGRDQDPVLTVSLDLTDGSSTCSNAVSLIQDQLGDGVRGDRLADALDQRASRRLVHCGSMTVSSLTNLDDEPIIIDNLGVLPDDIASYANRRDGTKFYKGSFLGRQSGLARNTMTNVYREINGAADGFPGWVVDRFDKWLFVQHKEGSLRGPLPSLHDGFTEGVYYLPTKANRSSMGSEKLMPTLLEGKPAPELFPVNENGVTYMVSLGKSFSAGIFLDQRLQRAWLSSICNEETRVLNCFAHTGAFSIAAAAAGASTVSLDLDKKWLERIRPQMEANGIVDWDGKHDTIYGDVFDWLPRLGKRGELYDIVVLDPPSTSVGKKKKRWSVENDMTELVALAAPLVKENGLLFTTTNASTLLPSAFANSVKKGLTASTIHNAKLERICPMPSDYLAIGTSPVKNLVWTINR